MTPMLPERWPGMCKGTRALREVIQGEATLRTRHRTNSLVYSCCLILEDIQDGPDVRGGHHGTYR